MNTDSISAEALIEQLGLQPHPEGGYFKETYRTQPESNGARSAGTAIFFLLKEGQSSHYFPACTAD